MDIAVIGCGYVGLVSGVCLAALGHKVVAVDVDKARVSRCARASCPSTSRGFPN